MSADPLMWHLEHDDDSAPCSMEDAVFLKAIHDGVKAQADKLTAQQAAIEQAEKDRAAGLLVIMFTALFVGLAALVILVILFR